jgi:hypothetical protein
MKKINQIISDECWPCCIAMVLDRPRKSVPYFKPGGDHSPKEFRDFWENWFRLEGIIYHSIVPAPGSNYGFEYNDKFWIAVAPGPAPKLHHSVVMCGKKLWHDPYRWNPRVRRPTKIHWATVLSA